MSIDIIASKKVLSQAAIADIDKARKYVNGKFENLKAALKNEAFKAIYNDPAGFRVLLTQHCKFTAELYKVIDSTIEQGELERIKTPKSGYQSYSELKKGDTPKKSEAEVEEVNTVDNNTSDDSFDEDDEEDLAQQLIKMRISQVVKQQEEVNIEDDNLVNDSIEYYKAIRREPKIFSNSEFVETIEIKFVFNWYILLAMRLVGADYRELFNPIRTTQVYLENNNILQISSITKNAKRLSYSLIMEVAKDKPVVYHVYSNKKGCKGWKSFTQQDLIVFVDKYM